MSVQWYDILRERSNIGRSISATQRTDTWTNTINSYVMVHFIYKLNIFGGRNTLADGPEVPDGGPGRGGPGGRGGGGRGGFGGPRF